MSPKSVGYFSNFQKQPKVHSMYGTISHIINAYVGTHSGEEEDFHQDWKSKNRNL
jgi:hypothetical protein